MLDLLQIDISKTQMDLSEWRAWHPCRNIRENKAMPWDHSLYIAAMAWKKNMWLVGGIPTPLKNVSLSVQITIPCIVEKKECSKPPTRWWGCHDLPGLIYIYGPGYNIVFNFQRDVKHNRTGRNAWLLTQGIPRESDRTNTNFGLNDGLNMLKTLRFDLPQQT